MLALLPPTSFEFRWCEVEEEMLRSRRITLLYGRTGFGSCAAPWRRAPVDRRRRRCCCRSIRARGSCPQERSAGSFSGGSQHSRTASWPPGPRRGGSGLRPPATAIVARRRNQGSGAVPSITTVVSQNPRLKHIERQPLGRQIIAPDRRPSATARRRALKSGYVSIYRTRRGAAAQTQPAHSFLVCLKAPRRQPIIRTPAGDSSP